MPLLPIIVAPDPRLKQKAKPVATVDDRIRQLMDDMVVTMHTAGGIGLAATQLGIMECVLVMDVAEKNEPPAPIHMANPEIIEASEEESVCNEGCLSFPEQFGDVTRPARVRVRYLDRDGQTQELEAEGILAVCVQHEMDHLNGITFVDRLSMLKRQMILRRLAKLKREGELENTR